MPQSSLLSCCPSGLCSAAISTLHTQLEALANLALLPALRMDLAAATRFYVSFLEDYVVLSGGQGDSGRREGDHEEASCQGRAPWRPGALTWSVAGGCRGQRYPAKASGADRHGGEDRATWQLSPKTLDLDPKPI